MLRYSMEETTATRTVNDDIQRQVLALEYRQDQIRKEGMIEDNTLYRSKSRFIDLVIEEIEIIEKIKKLDPSRYPWPTSSIYDSIYSSYQRSGATSYTLRIISDLFQFPQFEKYKSHIYNSDKRRGLDTRPMEALRGEKKSIDVQVQETIYFMENNMEHPDVQTYMNNKYKQMYKQEVRERKEIEEQDKVRMKRPDWIPLGQDGMWSNVYEATNQFITTLQHVSLHMWQYPPKMIEDDLWYARGIEALNAIFVPGADLKYVRDTVSYLEIILEKMTQSVHSAMSHSKIITISGKLRKMTREQIADIEPQYIALVIYIIEHFPGLAAFCLYLLREQKPYGGDFHIDRHPKLSESAFGKS